MTRLQIRNKRNREFHKMKIALKAIYDLVYATPDTYTIKDYENRNHIIYNKCVEKNIQKIV